MQAQIVHPDPEEELVTRERCAVLESWNTLDDPDVSIARARVAPGATTELHSLDVDERYLVLAGTGIARVGDLQAEAVGPGDVVVIPAGTPQQITNGGDDDLVFYCVCSPRFTPEGYRSLE
jgi:mannose-6-phosphate isomerase-like protein (cupin superfamily)